jgi:DNA repair photolyase
MEKVRQELLALSLSRVPADGLVGIARMAASADELDPGHLVQFHALKVKSILNKSVSRRRLTFGRSINPYRGCEFACRYCYARYTHEFMELRNPEDFERQIFVKQNAAWLLRQELRSLRRNEEIAIGTATDPYQPVEKKLLVTRSLLEVIAQCRDLNVGIVTKSTLITRDIDLLQQIAERSRLVVHLTITTTDADLARLLEPRAPRPDLRFDALRKLRQAGIRSGVLCSPLLPGLTDMPSALERIATAARQADASFLCAQPLFLKACSKETYLGFVREHFPQLEPLYRHRFNDAAFVSTAYAKRIRAVVHAVCRKHNLAERSSDALLTRDLGVSEDAVRMQGSLFEARATPGRVVALSKTHHHRASA